MRRTIILVASCLLGCAGAAPQPQEPSTVEADPVVVDSGNEPTVVEPPSAPTESKISQCNRLIKVISQNGQQIKEATARMTSAKEDTAAIADVADVMDASAERISAVDLTDERLQKLQHRYDEMLRQGAAAARAMVDAANANDLPGLTKAMGEISAIEDTEAELVNGVNEYCTEDDQPHSTTMTRNGSSSESSIPSLPH